MLEALATAISQGKGIKRIQIGKEVKLSLFADDILVCIEKPKEYNRKLLEIIRQYSLVSGYSVNTQNRWHFCMQTLS